MNNEYSNFQQRSGPTSHTFRSCPWAKNFQLFIPLIATLGTDTAWLKLFPAVLCLLSVAAAGYQAPVRRYLFTVMAIFSVVVVMRMTTNSVGQTNLTRVQTISSVSPYKGIVIRDAEQDRLNQYIADYNYQLSNVLSVGQECHLIRAVTGCQAARFNEFWSNIFDSVYTAKYREIIRAEHPVVFCSFSPQFKTKPLYKDKESAFERMLLEEGYRPLDRSNYKYMRIFKIFTNITSNYSFHQIICYVALLHPFRIMCNTSLTRFTCSFVKDGYIGSENISFAAASVSGREPSFHPRN